MAGPKLPLGLFLRYIKFMKMSYYGIHRMQIQCVSPEEFTEICCLTAQVFHISTSSKALDMKSKALYG